jgi:hypothetical protein
MGQVGWGIGWVIAELVHEEVVGNGVVAMGKCGWGISGELARKRVEEGVGGVGRQFGTVSPHSTSTAVERPS